MNKEQFLNYIDNPDKLNQESLQELQTLVDEYPYFQLAQMLYTKNLHNLEDIKYDKQLKVASIYINNREKLYFLINSLPKTIINENLDIHTNNTEEICVEQIPVLDKVEEKEDAFIITQPEEKIEHNDEILETIEISDLSVEIPKFEEKIKIIIERPTIEDNEILVREADIIKMSIADEILQRVENIRSTNEIEKKESIADIILRKSAESKIQKAQKIEENSTTQEFNDFIFPQTETVSEKQEIKPIEEDSISSVNTSDFENTNLIGEKDFVKIEEAIVHENSIENNSDKIETKIPSGIISEQEKEFSFSEWLNIVTKKAPEKINLNKKIEKDISPKEKNMQLIDKFIKEEPRIKPKFETAFKQEDISVKSAIPEDNLITETLAKIYIKQEHYEKAISIYEKLSLKNSENYAYFAIQIEKIKELINKQIN
ncbi:MAG TPA: hypothetical protein DDX39_09800 [Bacteroidales bacterium]|nr:MAG: hypothetical protein A2W98_01575 [Bacteroidetes bacterium GWF2_33_38]OFY90669.1 MAG: hypothetical protein A2236_04190 [Bacteroidetes bacterium RIFOXYA2_FULL_33_7]HBF88922.1 hypothetical protein [Bacteroidales bacterium]